MFGIKTLFVNSLVKLLSKIITHNHVEGFRNSLRRYYTMWRSNEFKKFGTSSHLDFKLVLQGGKHISIGERTGFGQRVVLAAWDSYRGHKYTPSISIGNDVWIGDDCNITAINSIIIEDNVLLGRKIFISDHSHGEVTLEALTLAPADRPLISKGVVHIKKGAWIGEKATILANVTIGENSFIGANSVVTKSVPSNTVVAGIPAKIIRML